MSQSKGGCPEGRCSDDVIRLVNLLAGHNDLTGTPVYEETVVEPLDGGRFKLVKTPGLVLDVAAGDILRVRPDGTFDVETRGGNVAIHIFRREGVAAIEGDVTRRMLAIRGRLDGAASKVLAYTVPVGIGFKRIEATISEIESAISITEWSYGNVYNQTTGEPLNWWFDFERIPEP